MDKLFSWFKIDYWHHAFILAGALGVAASMIFDIKAITNRQEFILFFGFFLLGIGEWIYHPLQTKIVPPHVTIPGGGIITGHPRNPKMLGYLFVLIGLILIATAGYKIITT